MTGGKIPKDHAEEVADCFAAYAQGLFGYACILTRGDRAMADDLVQSAFMPRPGSGRPCGASAIANLYVLHYRALVRLATMLLRDVGAAEHVVDDAFIAAHQGWDRLRDPKNALAFLRQAVVNRSRSVLRHRMVTDEPSQQVPPDMPGGEHTILSEAEIAAALGISRGAVKSHTARGMAALRASLEQ